MLARFLVRTVVAVALVASACTSSSTADDEAGTTADDAGAASTAPAGGASSSTSPESAPASTTGPSTTAEPVELTASWDGVTEDTIKLGFVDIDLATLREMGLVDTNNGDLQVVVDALVADLNARGGILGRQVEAFTEVVLPIDPAEAEAACLRLTEDENVFAVLGQFAGPTTVIDSCFATQGETLTIGGSPTPEQLDQANAPWFSVRLSQARGLEAALELMDEEGLLDGGLGIGVAPEDEPTADDIVIPKIEELGHEVLGKAIQGSFPGDPGEVNNEWGVYMERFATDGVDTIILVETTVAFGATQQLIANGFDGQILLLDLAGTVSTLGISGNNPLESMSGVVGPIGLTPQEQFDLPATQECIEVVEAANPDIDVRPSTELADGEVNWLVGILGVCTKLSLFEQVATAAGADLTPDTFVAAAEAFGEITLPGLQNASLGPGKLDVSDNLRLAHFDPDAGGDGGATPIGPLVQVDG